MNYKIRHIHFLLVLLVVEITAGCSTVNNSGVTLAPDRPTQTTPLNMPTRNLPAVKFGPPIHSIQGEAQVSPMNGQSVNRVHGVVTAVRADGFYMQDPDPDQNNGTSEAIFIYSENTPKTNIGDEVLVSGLIDEFYPGGIATGNLSITEIKNRRVEKLSEGMPLPTPVVIGRGGRVPPSRVIKGDAKIFDPDVNGLDFYESLENMRVQVNHALVVGPTNAYNETTVLADNGQDAGLRTPRGGIVLRKDDFNPERIIIDDLLTLLPEGNVGDVFDQPLVGVMDYSFGNFKIQLTQLPTLIPGNLDKEIAPDPNPDELSVASLNVQNLDPGDGKARFDDFARLIVQNLKSPDIISLDEIQDNNGIVDDQVTDASQTYQLIIDSIQAVGGPIYDFREIPPERNQDGGEPGGNIRVGFIYRVDRGVQFIDRGKSSPSDAVGIQRGSTGPELTLSPGRIDPKNAVFKNSRKPLVGEFIYKGQTVFVIGVHLNSKGGDSPLFGRYQPPVFSSEKQRWQQAEVIQAFVSNILAVDAKSNILVLGDFNDFQFSTTLDKLVGNNLKNLTLTLPENQQYSYLYDGNAQVLDQILTSLSLAQKMSYFDAVHVNAEFANTKRLSDHDPVLARFSIKSR